MILRPIPALMSICCLFAGLSAQTITLRAKDYDGKTQYFINRGGDYWGMKGENSGKVHEGEMWFDSFPGATGTYKIQLGAQLEPDGDPHYKVYSESKTFKSGRYPYSGGSLNCGGGSTKNTYLELGEHSIRKGEKITVWAKSVYYCKEGSNYHGAYTRWNELRFTLVDGAGSDDTPPGAPGNLRRKSATENSITLQWDAARDDESGIDHYVVYQEGTSVKEVTKTETTITNLLPGTAYSFAVSAVNGADPALEGSKSSSLETSTEGDPLPPLTVLSPNGGEAFDVGEEIMVRWEARADIDEVVVDITPDSGSTWIRLRDNSISRTNDADIWGKLTWTIPATAEVQGKTIRLKGVPLLLRVYDYNDNLAFDASNATFSINETVGLLQRWVKVRSSHILGVGPAHDVQGRFNRQRTGAANMLWVTDVLR